MTDISCKVSVILHVMVRSMRDKSLKHYLIRREQINLNTKEENFKHQIKLTYPKCADCSFLEKRKSTDEVYCFYRYKEKCLINM